MTIWHLFRALLYGGYAPYYPVNFPVVITLICLASITFKKLANPSGGIMYLTLPASTFEKVLVSVFQVQVYYFLLVVVAGLLGYFFASYVFLPLFSFWHVDGVVSYIDCEHMGWLILMLTVGISAMLFASVYFVKRAFLWSLLLGIAVVFVTLWIDGAILSTKEDLSNYHFVLSHSAVKALFIMGCSFITLFFWFMTWLRLRETEV
ncbi:MAG: hypothetical protein J5642_05610 [Bacteroidales bacterium]|nr:hypothetical protein [Bacteroidales bacterium]